MAEPITFEWTSDLGDDCTCSSRNCVAVCYGHSIDKFDCWVEESGIEVLHAIGLPNIAVARAVCEAVMRGYLQQPTAEAGSNDE